MVQTRRHERRLVGYVIVAAGKETVEALLECRPAAAGFYQAFYVVGNAEGVFPRRCFVEEAVPPCAVPRSFVRHVGRVAEHALLQPAVAVWYRVEPFAVGIARHDESSRAVVLIVTPPEILPSFALLHVLSVHVRLAEALCHLGYCPVAE